MLPANAKAKLNYSGGVTASHITAIESLESEAPKDALIATYPRWIKIFACLLLPLKWYEETKKAYLMHRNEKSGILKWSVRGSPACSPQRKS